MLTEGAPRLARRPFAPNANASIHGVTANDRGLQAKAIAVLFGIKRL